MPLPIPLVLAPHDPSWAEAARKEAERFAATLDPEVLVAVHHIGSTAIAGIHAKPILDLLPVVADVAALDAARVTLEEAGYRWWGEYGLPGRRYLTLESDEGARIAQLHVYERGSSEITRHLAFRDYVRANPDVAAAYDAEKARAASLHRDTYGYHEEKSAFVQRVEADALRWARR